MCSWTALSGAEDRGLGFRTLASAKVQKVGRVLGWPSKAKMALPRQSYGYTGHGSTYTSLLQGPTTLPPFGTFADGLEVSGRDGWWVQGLREIVPCTDIYS